MIGVLHRRLPLTMDLRPQGDIDCPAVRRQVNQVYEILKGDQREKNIVGARNTFDLKEIIGIGVAPGECNVVSRQSRSRRGANHLSDRAGAGFGAGAWRLTQAGTSQQGHEKNERQDKSS